MEERKSGGDILQGGGARGGDGDGAILIVESDRQRLLPRRRTEAGPCGDIALMLEALRAVESRREIAGDALGFDRAEAGLA